MTLIHSAELAGANPFDYLTALLRHADQVKSEPSRWLPWSYTTALAEAARCDATSTA